MCPEHIVYCAEHSLPGQPEGPHKLYPPTSLELKAFWQVSREASKLMGHHQHLPMLVLDLSLLQDSESQEKLAAFPSLPFSLGMDASYSDTSSGYCPHPAAIPRCPGQRESSISPLTGEDVPLASTVQYLETCLFPRWWLRGKGPPLGGQTEPKCRIDFHLSM